MDQRLVWTPTFSTQVNTNNIVMWETLQNNADWDCFKTPILQEILKIQNLLQVENCVFSGATRSFQSAGCVRKKPQFAQLNRIRNHFLGCRFEDGRYTRAWLMGSDCYCSSRKYESEQASTVKHVYISNAEANLMEWLMIWIMLILFLQTSILLVGKLCCIYLKATKQWSRWS